MYFAVKMGNAIREEPREGNNHKYKEDYYYYVQFKENGYQCILYHHGCNIYFFSLSFFLLIIRFKVFRCQLPQDNEFYEFAPVNNKYWKKKEYAIKNQGIHSLVNIVFIHLSFLVWTCLFFHPNFNSYNSNSNSSSYYYHHHHIMIHYCSSYLWFVWPFRTQNLF